VPSPELALAEAHRVLADGGTIAVFDGDYATATCANGEADPLQTCVEAAFAELVHDRWLVRRLPRLVTAAGFDAAQLRGHSYVDAPQAGPYVLALVDRGADALAAAGRIAPGTAASLKEEARRRSDARAFFGHIAYASLVARKRGSGLDGADEQPA
jgi:hypothetical protein